MTTLDKSRQIAYMYGLAIYREKFYQDLITLAVALQ